VTAAGLYVHVPFCLTRCGYCDFNTYAGIDHLQGGYVSALIGEAELHRPVWDGVAFVSVFFGGGTPTTLPVATLAGLLGRLRDAFDIREAAEITAEANPDTLDEPYLEALRAAGVNRLSIGVQSFDPAVLAALERIHGPASARAAFAAARAAGFEDVNVDLIYGAHGETPESWSWTLEEAIALGPDHVSAYALTIEPATLLGRKVAAGLVPAPNSDLQADMYESACELLRRAGFEHYEVSNWAKPGHRCVHNTGYWEGRPYLGLGAGAHSYRDGRRWWNLRPPWAYMRAVAAGKIPLGGEEWLTDEEQRLERLLLGLRLSKGIPAQWVDERQVSKYLSAGLVKRRKGRLALTEPGLFLANDVVVALGNSGAQARTRG
jgi:putative oxygen-independent coproporphyrinogen III oxidase